MNGPAVAIEAPEAPAQAPATRGRYLHARSPARRPRRWVGPTVSIVAYLLLSSLANWTAWAHGIAHSVQTAGGADVPEEIWFLAQTPWALLHGINPLANHTLNYPVGVNLSDNTSMSFLGIVGAPITFALGPVATFNVLLDLAFAASATTCFCMLRRFVSWWPAAFLGGLLYGFCPFAVAEGRAHIFLAVGALPPLVVLLLDRTLRTRTGSPWVNGVALGACLVAQFYISTEVFASMVVMMVLAAVVFGILRIAGRVRIDRGRLVRMAVVAGAVTVVGIGYGVWVALAGPNHIVGPAQPASALAGISSDPLGLVLPTINQHFSIGSTRLADSLVAERAANWHVAYDALLENGTYVGIPLLVVLVVGTVALRRRRTVLLSAVMALLALLLSFGSFLHAGGRRTGVPLPYWVLAHLPLLDSGAASRYARFFWLFAAIVFAVTLGVLFERLRGRRAQRRVVAALSTLAVAAVALFPLVPAWPYASGAADVPSWFTHGARSIPVGATVVVYPPADPSDAAAMVWQAEADFHFQMPQGYAVFATRDKTASFSGRPSSLQEALAACSMGESPGLSAGAIRRQLARWDTTAVVVVSRAAGSSCARYLFESALGPPDHEGGVVVWHRAASRA